MKEFSYQIQSEFGIHARPAGQLVLEAQKYRSEITLEKDDKTISLKKIFALMGLNVKCGETVRIAVSGDDEEQAASELENFIRSNF